MTLNILPIVGALILSAIGGFVFIPALLNFCKRKKLYDMPNQRKIHKCLIPRLGGIAFMPSMLLAFFIVTQIMNYEAQGAKIQVSTWSLGFLISLLLIYSVGIIDDLIGLDAKVKFVVQIIAASILPLCSLYINNLYGLFGIHEIPYYIGFPLTVFLLVFIDNAMNLIDGIDGLSASLTIISLIGFLTCFMGKGMDAYMILIAGLIGVLVSYLYFNLLGNAEKNRKIFMGDAGSLTLGFILGFLLVKTMMTSSLKSFAYEQVVLAYSLLIVPTFDVARVIIHRMRRHLPIFDADKSHIHHKLMATGLSQHKSLICILLLQIGFILLNMAILQFLTDSITCIFCMDIAVYTLYHLFINSRIKNSKTSNQ